MTRGPCRTLGTGRHLPASAALQLPAAPEAQRSRAKTSLASLAMAVLVGQGEPPTRSASCVHGGAVSAVPKMDEASQSLLEATGEPRPLQVLGQRRQGWWRTPRVGTLPQATRAPPTWSGGAGPPLASAGRGRPAENRRRPWEGPRRACRGQRPWRSPAPEARQGQPGHGPRLDPTHVGAHGPGRGRSPVPGKAHRRRLGVRRERRTPRWGTPTPGAGLDGNTPPGKDPHRGQVRTGSA